VALEHAVAGPLCSRHLHDLGAEVIKIERPGRGDFARDYDGYVRGVSSYHVWLNRGKKSVVLDLKTAAGKDALRSLLASADILVSNFGPRVAERIIPDEELARAFPSLIRCYITGYGRGGPYAERKAYDLLVQGEAGVTWSTGTPSARAKVGVSLADLAAGAYAATAVVAAVLQRMQTGAGTRVDVALFDVMAEWMMPLLLAARHESSVPEPAGLHHATIVPYGAYATLGGELVNIAVQTSDQWRRLCADVLHRDDWINDARYSTNAARLEHREELEAAIGAEFGQRAPEELIARLDQADIPWGRVRDLRSVLEHEDLQERHRWRRVLLPHDREASVVADPFGYPLADTDDVERVPELGEHTEATLAALGRTPEVARVADDAGGNAYQDKIAD
jgi:crotonobetainyl-CoA:carnitine CoA-transferase CaiB-like acyl-CoA transferase